MNMSTNRINVGATLDERPLPYAVIIKQPTSYYRMRYKAEKRTTVLTADTQSTSSPLSVDSMVISPPSSSLSPSSSSANKKNNRKKADDEVAYPKIQIVNGKGPATLIVSCVSKTSPHHVHPHRLVGDNCRSGVAIINIKENETVFELKGISIEFTKKSDIEQSINELKAKNVDPFKQGFEFEKSTIDLNHVRLCFQVYLRDSLNSNEIIKDKYHILTPIVSDVITNSIRQTSLLVQQAFNLHASNDDEQFVIIFLQKLNNKDHKPLRAKFYDETGWQVVTGDLEMHYQCATWFKAPRYTKLIEKDVKVNLKLFVPFASENEKAQLMDKLKKEDAGEQDSFIEEPDGKYESRILEFIYKPSLQSLKRTLNSNDLYETPHSNEKDGVNEISEETRKRMSKRLKIVHFGENKALTLPLYGEDCGHMDIAMTNTFMRDPSINAGSTLINEQFLSDNGISEMINSNFDSQNPNKFMSQFPPGTIDIMSGNNFVTTDVPMTSATAGGLTDVTQTLSPQESNENISYTLSMTDDDYVELNNFFENLN